MTLREQFTKETGNPAIIDDILTTSYAEWLEQQITIREQAAWDAARATTPNDDDSYFQLTRQTYPNIEIWRNSR